jgi:hypothetical protein
MVLFSLSPDAYAVCFAEESDSIGIGSLAVAVVDSCATWPFEAAGAIPGVVFAMA